MAGFPGTGEYIVRANFARKLGDALNQFSNKESDEPPPDPHDVLNRALVEFWGASLSEIADHYRSCLQRYLYDYAQWQSLVVNAEKKFRPWG